MRRRHLTPPLLVLLLGLAGCSGGAPSWSSACEEVGLCDPPLPAPELVDVVCDGSLHSTCDREYLGETLMRVGRRLVRRPGSHLRLWTLGSDVATTMLVGERVSPAPPTRRGRREEERLEQWVTETREVLLLAAAPYFEAPAPRTSPIAEAISKVGLAGGQGLPRSLVVVSDLRETAIFDFECKVPSEQVWLARLKRRGLLSPGLFAGARIYLTLVTGGTSGRCPVLVSREVRIRERWTRALEGAGAAEVQINSGLVQFEGAIEPSTGKEAAR